MRPGSGPHAGAQVILAQSIEDLYAGVPFAGALLSDEGFVDSVPFDAPVPLQTYLQRRPLAGAYRLVTEHAGERIVIPFSVMPPAPARRQAEHVGAAADELQAREMIGRQKAAAELDGTLRTLREEIEQLRRRAVDAEDREVRARREAVDAEHTLRLAHMTEVARLQQQIADLQAKERLHELEMKLQAGDRGTWDRLLDKIADVAPGALEMVMRSYSERAGQAASSDGATWPTAGPTAAGGQQLAAPSPAPYSGDGHTALADVHAPPTPASAAGAPAYEVAGVAQADVDVIETAMPQTVDEARAGLVQWIIQQATDQLLSGPSADAVRLVLGQVELYRQHGVQLGLREGLHLAQSLAGLALKHGMAAERVGAVLQPYAAALGLDAAQLGQITPANLRMMAGLLRIDLDGGVLDLMAQTATYLHRSLTSSS